MNDDFFLRWNFFGINKGYRIVDFFNGIETIVVGEVINFFLKVFFAPFKRGNRLSIKRLE
jgi:hypothetical protein